MTYYVIDKDDKILYHGEDKDLAIECKTTNSEATFILYQPEEGGLRYILRENY